MFGYIKPYVAELKVGEYEKYRAAYCGLCRSIGRLTGQVSRLTLSYDLVFLAAVRIALSGAQPEFEEYRCPIHVTKKRLVMIENPSLEYAAAFSAVMSNAKIKDDISDEKGIKRIRAAISSPFFSKMVKYASGVIPTEAQHRSSEILSSLSALEKENCSSTNLTADAFGKLLGYGFSFGLEGEEGEIAKTIGEQVGKFIYICDAADDMASDIKKKRYNPLAVGWGDLAIENGKMSPLVKESILTSVPIELEALGRAVEKLPEENIMTPIIKNIVYLGMPEILKKILYGDGDENNVKGKDRIKT